MTWSCDLENSWRCCVFVTGSVISSEPFWQIQYILGVTDWYHKRRWPSTSITHFTVSWFQHCNISSKSHEVHLRVLQKSEKTDLFPAVVSIVSMILPCENRSIADQISNYPLFFPIHSQKNWKKFLQNIMLVASHSGWGELFDGRWLFLSGFSQAATVRFFAAAALISLLEAASSVDECFQGP